MSKPTDWNEEDQKDPTDVPRLEDAASEYLPDPDAVKGSQDETLESHAAPQSYSKESIAADTDGEAHFGFEDFEAEAPAENLTFVRDPLQSPQLEIQEAQDDSEELTLDEPMDDLPEDDWLADDDDQQEVFQNLAESIAKEAEKHEEDLKLLVEQDETTAAERLAQEIAEDEALEKQMAEEAAQAEEEVDPELQAALPKLPEADESGELDLREMESCIESLLFMSDKILSKNRLQELLGPEIPLDYFEQALESLKARYQETHHGFELVEVAGGYQFRTKAGRAALAKKLAKVQTQRLSGGAMETLAIVAYRQPVLKDDIDKIRGVDSSHFIRGLLDKKLIRISGRSELPGRPMVYSTSQEFLELFGLNDLAELPSLRELEQMIPVSQSKNPEDEDPRVKEMRKLVGQMKTDTSVSLIYNPKEDEEILQQIREQVNSIPTSTPFIEQQKAMEKQAKLARENGEPVKDPEDLFEAALSAAAESAAAGSPPPSTGEEHPSPSPEA